MNVQFFKEPFEYFVIDDFLSPRNSEACLKEAIDKEPQYAKALVALQSGQPVDNCPECKLIKSAVGLNIRSNDFLNLNVPDKERMSSNIKSLCLL